jgi:hypothetical protein
MGNWFSAPGNGPEGMKNTVYGIIIGVLVVGLVWMVASTVRGADASPKQSIASDSRDRDHSTRTADPAQSAPPSPTGTTDDQHALRSAVLSSCHKVYDTQAPPLGAAATAMGQWQVHIAAMNQLVLGVISLQQANQFWNQTRDGAHANLHSFRVAAAPLRNPSALCPAPPSSPASGTGTATSASTRKVVGCERAVAARSRVLRSAEVALGTWSMHVMHMEMLRNGQMTPQHAEALWLHSWHEGQEEVTRYHAALRAARGVGC